MEVNVTEKLDLMMIQGKACLKYPEFREFLNAMEGWILAERNDILHENKDNPDSDESEFNDGRYYGLLAVHREIVNVRCQRPTHDSMKEAEG